MNLLSKFVKIVKQLCQVSTFQFIFMNIFLFFCIKKISSFLNIFDEPDNKLKKHKSKVPSLGGIIIATNIVLFILIAFFSISMKM